LCRKEKGTPYEQYRATRLKRTRPLEIKQSAQNELDALDDAPFSHRDRKILALADTPGPQHVKAKGVQGPVAPSGSVIGACYT
jgi:hypothetical protein